MACNRVRKDQKNPSVPQKDCPGFFLLLFVVSAHGSLSSLRNKYSVGLQAFCDSLPAIISSSSFVMPAWRCLLY